MLRRLGTAALPGGRVSSRAAKSRRPPRVHEKRAHYPFHALSRSPTKGPNRIHGERECAPIGRISTRMSFGFEMFGRISRERLVSVDAKFSSARRVGTSHEPWIASASRTQTLKNPNTQTLLRSVFRTMFPRRAMRLARWGYYIKNLGGRGALFAARKR